jgi:hypothetical protein
LITKPAADNDVVDMVLPAFAMRDDVIDLSGRWRKAYFVVELDLACWAVGYARSFGAVDRPLA